MARILRREQLKRRRLRAVEVDASKPDQLDISCFLPAVRHLRGWLAGQKTKWRQAVLEKMFRVATDVLAMTCHPYRCAKQSVLTSNVYSGRTWCQWQLQEAEHLSGRYVRNEAGLSAATANLVRRSDVYVLHVRYSDDAILLEAGVANRPGHCDAGVAHLGQGAGEDRGSKIVRHRGEAHWCRIRPMG